MTAETAVAEAMRIIVGEDVIAATQKAFDRNEHHTCDCPLPYIHRKQNPAIGVGTQLRMCCIATRLEEFMGLPKGTLLTVFEFEPTWEWDCDQPMITHDGTLIGVLGPPPEWVVERMAKRGIVPKNLRGRSGTRKDD